MPETPDTPDLEAARQLLRERRYEAATENARQHPPSESLQAFADLLLFAYWECKDIEAVIHVGRTGMAHALELAGRHSAEAADFKRIASVIAHNIASFCWAGWDEPGIKISPEAGRIGREAAAEHFRLVEDLQLPPLQQARAWWIVGAYQMIDHDWATARATFERACALANTAQSSEDRDLFQSYVYLVDVLAHPDAAGPQERLFAHKSALAHTAHGEDSLQQIETVEAFFKRHP